MPTHELGTITPECNFPMYVEQEWFGGDCERDVSVEVYKILGGAPRRLDIPGLTAAGCLATLPLTIPHARDPTPGGESGTFVVRYSRKRDRRLLAMCTVEVDRGPLRWTITLTSKV